MNIFQTFMNRILLFIAPELFGESKLLDLASDDEEYRNDSINNMQNVINLTRDLKKFFLKQRSLL